MLRSKAYATRATKLGMLLTAATVAMPAVTVAQDNRPVVVVFSFNNSAMGPGAADFAGVQTGIQDLLISDLASNPKYRLVDRARINQVLQEQNMVKNQQIDPQTAVRLGKIMGAQYAITGGFVANKGEATLIAYTVDMETTQISNGQKIQGHSDDVLGMIGQLSAKLASNMNLAPKAGVSRRSDAGESAKQSGTPATAQVQAQAQAQAPSTVEQFAKPVSANARKTKLDAASLKLYSSALDEIDKKNIAKARTLLEQVYKANPTFEQAKAQLDKLGH